MAPTASAKVEIAAPPTAVWAILMDFERYPDWNPFIIKISGDQKVGSRPTVTLKPPNNSSGVTFSPVIQTMQLNKHIHWKGRLLGIPWLFTGHHHFILHPTETGTKLEHFENFSGILALILHWIGSDVYETTERGFGLMNDAIKERAERKPRSNPELTQRTKPSVKADSSFDT